MTNIRKTYRCFFKCFFVHFLCSCIAVMIGIPQKLVIFVNPLILTRSLEKRCFSSRISFSPSDIASIARPKEAPKSNAENLQVFFIFITIPFTAFKEITHEKTSSFSLTFLRQLYIISIISY